MGLAGNRIETPPFCDRQTNERRAMTKRELIAWLATQLSLAQAQVKRMLDEVEQLTTSQLRMRGEFVIPGVVHITLQRSRRVRRVAQGRAKS